MQLPERKRTSLFSLPKKAIIALALERDEAMLDDEIEGLALLIAQFPELGTYHTTDLMDWVMLGTKLKEDNVIHANFEAHRIRNENSEQGH